MPCCTEEPQRSARMMATVHSRRAILVLQPAALNSAGRYLQIGFPLFFLQLQVNVSLQPRPSPVYVQSAKFLVQE